MKKKLLAMLLSLSMAMQMTVFAGAGDETEILTMDAAPEENIAILSEDSDGENLSTETEPETEAAPETEPETEPEPDSETEPETETEPEIEPETEEDEDEETDSDQDKDDEGETEEAEPDVPACTVCGEEICICCSECDGTTENHDDDCIMLCTCEPVDGVHLEGCRFYAAEVTVCEFCTQEPCICCDECDGTVLEHKNTCSLYINGTSAAYVELYDALNAEAAAILTELTAIREYILNPTPDVNWEYSTDVQTLSGRTDALWDKIGEAEKNGTLNLAEIDMLFGALSGSLDAIDILLNEITSGSLVPETEEEIADDTVEGTEGEPLAVDNVEVSGTIPADVVMEITDYSDITTFDMREEERPVFVLDITLTDSTGEKWQPAPGEEVMVTIDVSPYGIEDGELLRIEHEHENEYGEYEISTLGEYEVIDGTVTFETTGFSVFSGYIVDFEYNGIKYSMSGDSEIYLSELLDGLQLGYDIDDVIDVEFTNYDLLEITEEDGDWILKSLASFGTEEYLTITFDDGEVIEILVTDPVIYNYAVDNDITNVTLLSTKQHTVGEVDDGDTTAKGKTYTVNSTQITVDDVKKAGVEEKTNGKHPAPDAVHMIIYAKKGMAIDFIGGTDWTYTGSKPTFEGNDIWFWAWESSKSANYVIVKDGSAGRQSKFTVTTTVDGKKYYCNVLLCVVEDSSPILLEDDLPSGYSIKNVPVTLYNYDGKAFNEYYSEKEGNFFAFSGTSMGVNSQKKSNEETIDPGWTTSGVQANGGGGVALMGIVEDKLDADGLPVMSQGQKVDVFSESSDNGKTVYSNVNFQFIYNEKTGYYNYNSALNHAQFDDNTNTIELYKQSLAPSDTPNGTSHGNAGFYPFEDINKAFTNTGYSELTDEEWIDKLENDAFELIPSQYSTDIVVTGSTNPASTVDMHYGLQVKSDFYLPKGKKLNDQDMVYEFTGDDDLWVFIDGNLVLDIGGGHTHVSGSFNLTTGEVWVEKYTQLAEDDGGSYSVREQGMELEYTDDFLTGLQDDQMHTIQIFYLERHGGVSNCRMRFNLPLVPSNAVNVSKNVKNYDNPEEGFAVTPDGEYTFILYTAEGNDDTIDADATSFAAYAEKPYSVMGNGAPNGTQYTKVNGEFTLKDGWTASFEGIPRFTEVYVVEVEPDDGYTYPESKVSVNNEDAVNYKFGDRTDTKVMQLNTRINFDFINSIDTEDLVITKKVEGDAKDEEAFKDLEYIFELKINNGIEFTDPVVKEGDIEIKDGQFKLKNGDAIKIDNIPVGLRYTLLETLPGEDGYDTNRYAFKVPKYNDEEGKDDGYTGIVTANTSYTEGTLPNQITVLNEVNKRLADLKITKSISADDYKAEHQSFLFNVLKDDTHIMTVVINTDQLESDENGNYTYTVTIKDLLIDTTYTVTEAGDWSTRYTTVSIEDTDKSTAKGTITLSAAGVNEVTVTNTRGDDQWLDGNTQCTNLFNGNGKETHYKDEED